MIGSGTDYKVNNDQRRELNKLLSTKSALELQSSHVQMFNKAKWNGSILYTQGYKRVSKRNSYTVSYSPLDQEITIWDCGKVNFCQWTTHCNLKKFGT